MLIEDPTLLKDLKAGVCNPAELGRYLLNHYPATVLANELAEAIIEQQTTKPIVLTKEAFESHFRIQGWRFEEGQWFPETRGQFSKKK